MVSVEEYNQFTRVKVLMTPIVRFYASFFTTIQMTLQYIQIASEKDKNQSFKTVKLSHLDTKNQLL
jgi:hypothetical protein